jgi:RNA polymerase sigma factor (sigma-70 family)
MSSPQDPGPTPSFDSWFMTSKRWLLELAMFYTRDAKHAEDIAQEAAIKVFKAWNDEPKRGKILTSPGYTGRIVRNCYLDYIKGHSRTNQSEVELDPIRHDRSGISEEHDDVRSAVLSLEGDQHLLIILNFYYGLTIKEAGRQLGLSSPKAYRLHAKALAQLAGLLNEGEA